MKIVEIVRPHMQTEDMCFRLATPVEKKVAACLWSLANGHAYRTIMSLGMGVSSVMKYTHDFCDILCRIRKEYIRIPKINELSPRPVRKAKYQMLWLP